MPPRRSRVRVLVGGLVALAVLVLPALAEELLGTVKSVDADAKKLVVSEKGTLVSVEVTVTDRTAIETRRGESVPLEKLKTSSRVRVTHEDGVASKIVVQGPAAKKGERDDGDRKGDAPTPKRTRERPEP